MKSVYCTIERLYNRYDGMINMKMVIFLYTNENYYNIIVTCYNSLFHGDDNIIYVNMKCTILNLKIKTYFNNKANLTTFVQII